MEDQVLMESLLDANEVSNVDDLFTQLQVSEVEGDEFMSEKEFEDFMAKAEQNRNNRDDDINPYNYFKKGEFDIDPVEMNSKDMEIDMLLDRIQEQDQRLIELEASVAQNEEFTIDNTEMEQMDMVNLKEDISGL